MGSEYVFGQANIGQIRAHRMGAGVERPRGADQAEATL